MADIKVTDLSELAEEANDNDFFHIVDSSDTTHTAQGTSKKIKRSNVILGLFKKSVDTLDDITVGTTNKHFTDTEKTKLAGIEDGAEVNNISDTDATDLTDGGETSLHIHDGRYYTEGEIDTILDDYILETEKGANNGVATLDAGGKIPASQLPSTVMEFKGSWNANTNSPTLADGVGDSGDVYLVSVAGSQDLGSGSISFAIGDWVVYNGSVWEKSLNSNDVVSVNGQQGVVVLDADDIDDSATTNKFATSAEKTKLGFISVTQAVDLDVMEADIATNNAKVTNATHTGEVTGATALTLHKSAITNKLSASPQLDDLVLISDADDSENLKKVSIENIGSLFGQIPIGGIIDYAGTSFPTGYFYCDGSEVSRTTYAELFAVIGTAFGAGDGSTTFNLPDLRGRVSAGKDNMNNTAGTGGGDAGRLTSASSAGVDGDTLGASGGVQEHTLTSAQSGVPAHTHGYFDRYNINDNVFANGTANRKNTLSGVSATTNANTPADASSPHTNVQPTLVLNKLIRYS